MKRPAFLLLVAASFACAGPTAEIATDGIRLGWRFGAFHPFLKGDFAFEYEDSRYLWTVRDSVATDIATKGWNEAYGAFGGGIDWSPLEREVSGGIRVEGLWAPISTESEEGFIATFRLGPILEKRWGHLVLGASWAPAVEWSRYEYSRTYPKDPQPNLVTNDRDFVDITSSPELHLRYEF